MLSYKAKLSGKIEIELSFEEYKKLAQVLALGIAKFVILENRIINTAYIIALDFEYLPYSMRDEKEGKEIRELKAFFEGLGSRYPQLEEK